MERPGTGASACLDFPELPMNPKTLIIAVGILAILGGAVYYTKENPPPSGEEKPKLVSAEKDQVQELTITRPGKDPITVQRGEDNKWTFAPPLTIPADSSSVGFMADSAATLEADRVVEENVTDWKPYGLDEPTLILDVKLKDGKSHRVLFGKETPTGSSLYARIDGDPRLFTVYSYTKSSFEKEVFDLRDKKLLNAAADKISRIVVNTGGSSIEFGKSGETSWQILKPQPMRADNFTVGDLARAVQGAEMVSVVQEGDASAPKVDFSKPYATVEATDEAGAHTLTLAKQGEKYYARSSDLEGVYEVSSTLADSLNKKLEDFRNKKLFDFGFSEVAKLQVRDGETRVAVEKKDNKWVLASEGGRELASEKVQTLIDSLRNLSATSFTSDAAADQGKFGLTSPAIEVEVTQEQNAATEKVVITSSSSDKVYAAREGQPTTYQVEKSAVEEIHRAVEDLLKQEEPAKKDTSEADKKEEP
jgi:hypothetical protein